MITLLQKILLGWKSHYYNLDMACPILSAQLLDLESNMQGKIRGGSHDLPRVSLRWKDVFDLSFFHHVLGNPRETSIARVDNDHTPNPFLAFWLMKVNVVAW